MKKHVPFHLSLLSLLLLMMASVNLYGQDQSIQTMQLDHSKTIKKPAAFDSSKRWNLGGRYDLNLAQGSQSNWASGGDDFSFSVNSYLGFYAFYKENRWSWDNTLDLQYGLLNTTSQGSRKNDDRIDLLSKIGYELAPKLSVTGLFNFHSQFSKGYNYNSDGSKELLSNFMAPGYFVLGVGLDYKPAAGLSIFASPITTRWTLVKDTALSNEGAYGVTPGKKSKNEIGAFVSVNYQHNITKTINYKGRVDLFSNYEKNPQNVDVLMSNLFTAKLTKVLAVSLALDMIYDDDVKLFGANHDSPGLQLKSLIGVGLSVKL